jgi:hypothetical protein
MPRARTARPTLHRLASAALGASAFALGACASSANDPTPAAAARFYAGDYADAREILRATAYREPPTENTVLAASALGFASLAAGSTYEAQKALLRAYDFLESGAVNDEGRVFAATVFTDAALVYKGEPFEQAMTYHALAVAAALEGDWETVRIASRAATRKLRDYDDARTGKHSTPEQIARRAENEGDGFLENEARLVDTDFAAAYLLEAIADRALGIRSNAIELAIGADPSVEPIARAIEQGVYNTVIIAHTGRGPIKQNVGRDGVSTLWGTRANPVPGGLLLKYDNTQRAGPVQPVEDVNAMSRDHRWINLQSIRELKSVLGDGLIIAGAVVTQVESDSAEGVLIGIGLIGAGLLSKAGAQADTRHNPLLPAAVYIMVANLPSPPEAQPSPDLVLQVAGVPDASYRIPRFTPGTADNPAVAYFRFVGTQTQPGLDASVPVYAYDAYPPAVGDYPWILGGRDVSTPSAEVLRIYQAGGFFDNWTVEDLERLYFDEGIQFAEGPLEEGDNRHDSYRHILEGGKVLFTPSLNTLGAKLLYYAPHPPYQPVTDRVRQLAEAIRAEGPAATARDARPYTPSAN